MNGAFTEDGIPVTIVGAAKVLGNAGGNSGIGCLPSVQFKKIKNRLAAESAAPLSGWMPTIWSP